MTGQTLCALAGRAKCIQRICFTLTMNWLMNWSLSRRDKAALLPDPRATEAGEWGVMSNGAAVSTVPPIGLSAKR